MLRPFFEIQNVYTSEGFRKFCYLIEKKPKHQCLIYFQKFNGSERKTVILYFNPRTNVMDKFIELHRLEGYYVIIMPFIYDLVFVNVNSTIDACREKGCEFGSFYKDCMNFLIEKKYCCIEYENYINSAIVQLARDTNLINTRFGQDLYPYIRELFETGKFPKGRSGRIIEMPLTKFFMKLYME